MSLKSHFSDFPTRECGCDEVGRGCLAGPLFAAAVIFPYDFTNAEINDSKQLSRKKREELCLLIQREALAYNIVQVSEQEIDKINILRASFKGMNKAVKGLELVPELLLIDGNRFINETGISYQCVVKGDAQYLSIAAASILAKQSRDLLMEQLDLEYPEYDWKNNKGYPTVAHQQAILSHGLSPYHRRSFHLKNQLKIEF